MAETKDISGFKVIGDALTKTLQGLGKVLAAGATAADVELICIDNINPVNQ